MAGLAALARGSGLRRPTTPHSGADVRELADRVRAEVDLRLLVRELVDSFDEFSRFDRVSCLSPDHPDGRGSMLVYADGCHCQACGFKADAIALYRACNPEANFFQAAEALLSGEYALGELNLERRELRQLDPDTATRHHLALYDNQQALGILLGFGFLPSAIQHFRLGLAQVRVRLDPEEPGFREDLPELEWYTDSQGKRVPVQLQWRFSVPVLGPGGSLRQIIYRKFPGTLGGKTTTERDAGVWLYNEAALDERPEEAVLCEGWGDVVVLWQCGITAVTSTSGAGHYSEAWTPKLKRVPRLRVLGDDDNAGRKMMLRVRKHIPWAEPLSVKWPQGSKDPRDAWVAGWRKPEFRAALDAYTPWTKRRQG